MNTNFLDLGFNKSEAQIMHVDINSCFATIEQQANPFLRGKPVAVMANADKSFGVVLAASIEAKRYGVKTGMRYRDARLLCPHLLQVSPDANKYRAVHLSMRKIFSDYTDDFHPKSIDEFVLNLTNKHRVKIRNITPPRCDYRDLVEIAKEIKQRIREEIGEWISVSIGIGTNRFFAKTAAGIVKPDGLVLMNWQTAREVYSKMDLLDIHGINVRNKARLNSVGIYSPLQFLEADIQILKRAFKSVGANYWYTRLRGWEIDGIEFARRSFGNTYTLSEPLTKLSDLSKLLMKLTTKASARLRKKGYIARGVHVGVRYDDHTYWHHGHTQKRYFFGTSDIYTQALKILKKSPRKPVRNLAVTCFDIKLHEHDQLELFDDVLRKKSLVKAIDTINQKWGEFAVVSARMSRNWKLAPDVIGFGNVKEL